MSAEIVVHDDVLADPVAYRAAALSCHFDSVTVGPDTFHGMAVCTDPTVPAWIEQHYPTAHPWLTFFRRSPLGQPEPNFIHTDKDMGDWTAILYLNPTPADGDGTVFWRHRSTGNVASMTETPEAWRDVAQWECWHTVAARFNRLVLFPAPLFHSRTIAENYGAGDDARLIQVVFANERKG